MMDYAAWPDAPKGHKPPSGPVSRPVPTNTSEYEQAKASREFRRFERERAESNRWARARARGYELEGILFAALWFITATLTIAWVFNR